MSDEKIYYGGQAVIEGVMMRGRNLLAIAVRNPKKDIVTEVHCVNTLGEKYSVLKYPFIRGVVQLLEALVWGIKALSYSAQIAGDEDEKLSSRDIALTIIVAIAVAIGLFVVIPTAATKFFHSITDLPLYLNILEGLLRMLIFLAYIAVISLMKDIQRVFQYHGAEHKTINAWENGSNLTVREVQKYSTRHFRCGTSFLLMVMVISIIVFAFLGWPDVLVRIVSRVILLPVVAGLAYEIIKFSANHYNNYFMRIIIAPGMWLQAMTTKEPEDDQVEVAIVALKAVLPRDQELGNNV